MRRKACLIGNNDYMHWDRLSCAVNDAERMEDVLQKCGFETTVCRNLNMEDLRSTLAKFRHSLVNCDAGLLFFAGHGVESDGKQYLVPTDALRDISDPDKEMYDTTSLINLFSECTTNEVNFAGIIVFDCCRTRISKSSAIRGPDAPSPPPAKGVYIAFATEPDKSAKEKDKHGVFTQSLYAAIDKHGSEKIEDVFKRARKDVINQFKDQIPWDHSSLLGDFYFQDTAALLQKSVVGETDWLAPSSLETLFSESLCYSEIKNRIYRQADKVKASLSQKENLLILVLDQLDSLYINRTTPDNAKRRKQDD